jgi:uncharacterized membrane protein YoaK (UPF0700 family)
VAVARTERAERLAQTLLVVLSVTAGCTDVISFLGLDGLFTAHITGNLVLLAAHTVGDGAVNLAQILSVPVFIVIVALAAMLAGRLEASGIAPLRLLLLLQFVLLAGFLVLGAPAGPRIAANSAGAIVAGMFGVAAMAVQNALVQISFKGAPSTAVMTTNVTRFALDVGHVLLRADGADAARKRAARTLPVMLGFALGCGAGAVCEVRFGLWSLALPVGLALAVLMIGNELEPREDVRNTVHQQTAVHNGSL